MSKLLASIEADLIHFPEDAVKTAVLRFVDLAFQGKLIFYVLLYVYMFTGSLC